MGRCTNSTGIEKGEHVYHSIISYICLSHYLYFSSNYFCLYTRSFIQLYLIRSLDIFWISQTGPERDRLIAEASEKYKSIGNYRPLVQLANNFFVQAERESGGERSRLIQLCLDSYKAASQVGGGRWGEGWRVVDGVQRIPRQGHGALACQDSPEGSVGEFSSIFHRKFTIMY